MFFFHIWRSSTYLFALYSYSLGCSDESNKRPIATALLDLHAGESCEMVNFHALQQLAALKSKLKVINSDFLPERIEINLQVFDTCSTIKGTRIATLKALVAAEQTCTHTPLFLGFMGPENEAQLEVSQSISRAFNIGHVIPHSFHSGLKELDYVHYITSYPLEQHTQAILILIKKLGIQNIVIVHDDNSLSKMKMKHLIENLKNDICLIKSVAFDNTDNFEDQLELGNIEDGILVLTENAITLNDMADFFVKYNRQVVISSGKIGALNFLPPLRKPAFVLQFTSLNHIGNLSKEYDAELEKVYNDKQMLRCLSFIDKFQRNCSSAVIPASIIADKDWTVDLLEYGLQLYASGIRIAAYKKCKQINSTSGGICSRLNAMSQKEWNSILGESSTFTQDKTGLSNDKIKFNMDIKGKYIIYLFNNSLITRIGAIIGPQLEFDNNHKFPTTSGIGSRKCFTNLPKTTTSTTEQPQVKNPLDIDLNHIKIFFDFDIPEYEVIGVLLGIGFGIVSLLGLVVYAIYSTVKVKSSKSIRSDSSSQGSIRTPISELS